MNTFVRHITGQHWKLNSYQIDQVVLFDCALPVHPLPAFTRDKSEEERWQKAQDTAAQ